MTCFCPIGLHYWQTETEEDFETACDECCARAESMMADRVDCMNFEDEDVASLVPDLT